MADYKQLCAELVDAIDSGIPAGRMRLSPLMLRARAALAELEPEGPTDAEIMEMMPQQMHEDLAAAARAMAEQTGVDSVRVKGLMRIILNRHSVDYARAVLARWGK